MKDSSTSSEEVKSPLPKWQFRDQVIPARLCHLLRAGTINGNDLLLMFGINSLVRAHTSEHNGLGCYASNEYLANITNTVPTYVSRRLHHLAEKGLIVICKIKNQRYLELEWSRTAEERASMKNTYGKAHKKAHRELLNRLKNGSNNNNQDELRDCTPGASDAEGGCTPSASDQLALSCKEGGLHESANNTTTVINIKVDNREKDCCHPPDSRAEARSPGRVNGASLPPRSSPDGRSVNQKANPSSDKTDSKSKKQGMGLVIVKEKTFAQKSRDRLEVILKAKGKLMRKPSPNWTGLFSKLEDTLIGNGSTSQEAQRRISDLLDWYECHIGQPYVAKSYSAETFCDGERFLKMEEMMNDQREKDREAIGDNSDLDSEALGQLSMNFMGWAKSLYEGMVDLGVRPKDYDQLTWARQLKCCWDRLKSDDWERFVYTISWYCSRCDNGHAGTYGLPRDVTCMLDYVKHFKKISGRYAYYERPENY